MTKKKEVDPRAKLLFALSAVITAVLLNSAILLLFLLLLLVTISLLCGIGPKGIAKRLVLTLPFAGIMALWQPFVRGGTVLFSLYGLEATAEGSIFGIILLLRVFAAITALGIFTATTSETEIGGALRYIRVPSILVATMLMTLRYISLLDNRRKTIHQAQASRLFVKRGNPAGYRWVLKNLANGMAVLFISSYEQGERVYESMLARGYRQGDNLIHWEGAGSTYSSGKTAAFCGLTILLPALVIFAFFLRIPLQ